MPHIKQTAALPGRTTSIYPEQFAREFSGRTKRALTAGLGLTQFGVNVTTLEPGAKSSLRHWHASEDEAIYVLSGEITLIDDAGETTLEPGAAAGFPAGEKNAHHLVNRTDKPAVYLEIGSRCPTETATYPDDDLTYERKDGEHVFRHKDGTRYK